MSAFPASTSFVNILVFITPSSNPEREFDVVTAPAAPTITERDTVINYQIFSSAGEDIVFTGATIEPKDNDQLSTPVVSVSGKMLTLSDANTIPMDLNVTLNLANKSRGGHTFSHDPQIINNPPN